MKKFIITALFLIVFFKVEGECNTESSDYFPLQVGNAFYYLTIRGNPGGYDTSFSISRITHLQNFYGKTYYFITNFFGNINEDYYLRYDSTTGNLLCYDSNSPSCNFEKIVAKLSAFVGDSCGVNCLWRRNYKCYRICDTTVFNNMTNVKKFKYSEANSSGYFHIQEFHYARNFGPIFTYYNTSTVHSFQSQINIIKGAFINGAIYGDTNNHTSSIYADSGRYYPLQVGNTFYYKHHWKGIHSGFDSSYYVSRVLDSSIIRGKLYYKATNFFTDDSVDYIRYDSLTGKLVSYDSLLINCNYEREYYILSAVPFDSANSQCVYHINQRCEGLNDTTIFGMQKLVKSFTYQTSSQYGSSYLGTFFVKDIGIAYYRFFSVEYHWGLTSISYYNLVGAKINGVVYGDTNTSSLHDFSAGPFIDFPEVFIKDSSYHIKAKITNEGREPETNVPIRFLINGTQVGYYLRSLPAGGIDTVDFTWTPHTAGDFNVAIASALPTDINRSNDTVKADVRVYSSPALPIFCDDFSGGTSNWTITNVGGTCIWQAYSPPYPNAYSLPVTSSGAVLSADADECGSGTTLLSTATIIENVDCSMYENVYLEFDNDWNAIDNQDSAIVEVSYDGSTSWSSVIAWGGTDVRNTQESYTLSGADANPNVKIRFRSIQPGWDWWWAIDNVCLKGFPLTGFKQNNTIPTKYALIQNYPNPFNPTTKIRFDLPKSTQAKLIIYDILGREVATLVNEKLNAGSYIIDWNGSSYPSGVYFYKLLTKDFSQTKRMVLIK